MSEKECKETWARGERGGGRGERGSVKGVKEEEG